MSFYTDLKSFRLLFGVEVSLWPMQRRSQNDYSRIIVLKWLPLVKTTLLNLQCMYTICIIYIFNLTHLLINFCQHVIENSLILIFCSTNFLFSYPRHSLIAVWLLSMIKVCKTSTDYRYYTDWIKTQVYYICIFITCQTIAGKNM